MTKLHNFSIAGLLISSLGFVLAGGLCGCTVQNKMISPMPPQEVINQGLPIFINAPAIDLKKAQSDVSVPQNLYLIVRDGHVLNRYESAQSFDQLFNAALNQAVLSMQFQESMASPYVLNTHIDFLKVQYVSHANNIGLLTGKLVVNYSLKLNNNLIWDKRFESHATMPYQDMRDEGQAVSGIIQVLVSNNLGQFGQGLNHACFVKPQGITC